MRNPAAADDVTQETFIAAQQRIGLYNGGSLLAWLLTIAKRRCINHLRAGFREPRAADPWHEPMHAPEFSAQSGWEDRLAEVLRQLSAPQRICFKLFHIDGYSYKEIAAQTGYSLKEVKTHIQNGQRRFRILWGDQP